jgi:hypothetical protein
LTRRTERSHIADESLFDFAERLLLAGARPKLQLQEFLADNVLSTAYQRTITDSDC